MSEDLRCIAQPAAEPVTLAQFKGLLRIPLADTSRDSTLTLFLQAAREAFEGYCRIAIVTQTWLYRLDSFPGISPRYDRNGFPQFPLPRPPFQSVDWISYVDTGGVVQTLARDTSYGANPAAPFYGYQMQPGGGIAPAWISAPWARPNPPQRMVPANTLIQFRCGYGGPLTVSMTSGSAALAAPGFAFNPDDAPAMVGDVGTPISIPGAGAASAALLSHVAAVDGSGNATLAVPAATSVAAATAWLGDPVPYKLQLGILFLAQHFHEAGAVLDIDEPGVIERLRRYSRNLVS